MTADNLKKSILQQAIQGKLLPQNPADEPASELLKKISAQRQKLIDEGKIKAAPPLPPISPDEIPFDIPQSWQWARLGDIVILENGDRSKSYPKDNDYLLDGVPFWGASDMVNNMLAYTKNLRFISQKKFSQLKAGKLKDKDFVCLLRGNVGKFAQFNATEKYSTGFINAQMVIMRLMDIALADFYSVFLKSSTFLNQVNQSVKGTSIAQMSAADLKNFLLPLPPLKEQKRIVAKLEELMPLLERLDAAEKKLAALNKAFPDKLKKSILQAAIQGKLSKQLPTDGNAIDLLADMQAERAKLIKQKKIKTAPPLPPISPDEIPFDIPENWCWVRLGDICNYGDSESISPQNMTFGKFLLDLEDIEKNSGKLINKKFFDGNNAKSSKSIFYKGNVLYGKLRPYLNKVLIADEDGYCTSEILPLNFGENIFNEYVKIFFITPFFSSYATNLSCGTKMPRLRTEDGKKALFPLPPLAEQKRIVAKLEELLPLCDRLAEKISK